ncbi:MAG: ComEA family DNA-binding protein [Erysipelotrichia bacterium]|nr:ComEA family DNA-binding protein [Erysipelotrichia bacterium]
MRVEIKGAIKNPASYELNYQSKIKDLIAKAGGVLENADLSALNMNADLHDKDVIVIQTIETEKRKVSINSASLEELTTLNGIGSATAQKIIDYRTQVRSFQTLEDIMQVKGIKEGLFAKIKDQICL